MPAVGYPSAPPPLVPAGGMPGVDDPLAWVTWLGNRDSSSAWTVPTVPCACALHAARRAPPAPVPAPAAYCYMARLQRGHGGMRGSLVRVDALTAHRMMAVGTVVATKFFDDK